MMPRRQLQMTVFSRHARVTAAAGDEFRAGRAWPTDLPNPTNIRQPSNALS